MAPHYFQGRLITLLFVILIFYSSNVHAWTGYDNHDGSEIEIFSGNLVREGEEIKFYDWNSEEDRIAEVTSIEYLLDRTRLEIFDFIAKKNRIFDME